MTSYNRIDPKTNILYGGPDPENYEYGCGSLGELYVKRLTQHGDAILLVRAFIFLYS